VNDYYNHLFLVHNDGGISQLQPATASSAQARRRRHAASNLIIAP